MDLCCRIHLKYCPVFTMSDTFQGNSVKQRKWGIVAVRRKKTVPYEDHDTSPDESGGNTSKKTQRAKSRKKLVIESLKESSVDKAVSLEDSEENFAEASTGASKETAAHSSLSPKGSTQKNAAKWGIRTDMDVFEGKSIESKIIDVDETSTSNILLDVKEDAIIDDGEDISFTYGWPPLVCCFGAAQYFFIPSGRLANRLIDHEIHESKKDMFWIPTKFVRAPGGSLSSVAIAHASMGGRVAFMGNLGDDVYGETMIYHLNVNKVQTRAIKINDSRRTAISYMKISGRGGLKATCVIPCAEDSFLSSEIKIDVLKEAKMFYFNSSSLLQQRMRSTTLEAIKISKKFGGVVFLISTSPYHYGILVVKPICLSRRHGTWPISLR
ncbi:hypothetical protein HPP92_018554 [Vanilla planifolia]|uniref:Carbohydrate kinase PfkB domain-containing protein n=1 Tax=Vanilla planifolia TaxID=51239 RepID=A0A835URN8_VANPL|nr:hypothetical protein HPP92_019173 [Vanilla planifolia]KAG0469226.1 hypothetical protein HPP92_018554 [Vanilla planifolia]